MTRLHAQADVALGAVIAAHEVIADGAAGQAAEQAAQLQARHLRGRIRHALVLRAVHNQNVGSSVAQTRPGMPAAAMPLTTTPLVKGSWQRDAPAVTQCHRLCVMSPFTSILPL